MGIGDFLGKFKDKFTQKEQKTLALFGWMDERGEKIKKANEEDDQETARWHFQVLNRVQDISGFIIQNDLCFEADSKKMADEFQKIINFIDVCLTKLLIFFPKKHLQDIKTVETPYLSQNTSGNPERRKMLIEELWTDLVDLETDLGVQIDTEKNSGNAIIKPFPIEKAAKLYWALQIDRKIFEVFANDLKIGKIKTHGAKSGTWEDASFTAGQLGFGAYHNKEAYMDKYPNDPDVRSIKEALDWMTGRNPKPPKPRTKKPVPDINQGQDGLRNQIIPDYLKLFETDQQSLEKMAEEEIQMTLKKKFRELALKFHPDRNRGKEQESTEQFKKISEAYTVLIDRDKRYRYLQTQSQ